MTERQKKKKCLTEILKITIQFQQDLERLVAKEKAIECKITQFKCMERNNIYVRYPR